MYSPNKSLQDSTFTSTNHRGKQNKRISVAKLTLSPGKAISGLEMEAILARAWQALTFPASVPSRASGIKA